MNIPQIRKLKPALKKFLKRFDHCFPRKDTRAHLPVYVSGQLSDLRQKSVEPIALNAGVPVRTLSSAARLIRSASKASSAEQRGAGPPQSQPTKSRICARYGSSCRPPVGRATPGRIEVVRICA